MEKKGSETLSDNVSDDAVVCVANSDWACSRSCWPRAFWKEKKVREVEGSVGMIPGLEVEQKLINEWCCNIDEVAKGRVRDTIRAG